MADIDIEKLIEAPVDKRREKERSERKRKRSRSKSRKRSRSNHRERSRDRRERQRKEEKRKQEEKEREEKRKEADEAAKRKRDEEVRMAEEEAELCERDKRTVFVYHLHPRVTPEELKEFFTKAGKVRDCRLITDKKTGKSKGFGYIEFYDPGAVVGALTLQGIELRGHAVMVKVSEAEKNLPANATAQAAQQQSAGSTRLFIGNLNPRITDADLMSVFSELGEVDSVQLQKDEGGQSRGFAYLKYKRGEDAKKALVQLNGVTLANMKIKVGLVNESAGESTAPDDAESLNARGRALLMAKLQGQTTVPVANPGLLALPAPTTAIPPPLAIAAPAPIVIPSPSLVLKNLFDPSEETDADFDEDIKEDVCEECNRYGKLVHVHVDKNSKGFVYMMFDNVEGAKKTYEALHKRWFAKRLVTAEYVPVVDYKRKFGLS